MLQIGTLEALIGRKSAILRGWLVRARWIPVTWSLFRINGIFRINCTTVVVLAWQVGLFRLLWFLWFWYCQVCLFHLKLTQINSEMNWIARHKCPDSQKVDTYIHTYILRHETQRWEIQRVSRATTCVLDLCILSLWFILCDARKDSENVCVINGTLVLLCY